MKVAAFAARSRLLRTKSAGAATLLDRIVPIVRTRLPAGVDADYFDDFLDRNRPALVAVIEANLAPLLRRVQAASAAPTEDLPELWSAAQRTAANIAAMTVAAALAAQGRAATAEERRVLAGYSGWGGLSIRTAAGRFPPGFPVPEERGLIHEFYTPTRVAREIARLVGPLLPAGEVHALEPSAGIGRMVRAFEGLPRVAWHAVEWSELSGRMLSALRPDLDLFVGPFERWVRERGPDWQGRLQLVVSNPPYGIRGASIAEDPDRAYREKMAYHYFLRRGLDLLAPDGIGVFLVPGGFLTSRSAGFVALREKVLKRHHLAAAFRLPSMRANGREAIFPGAMLVTDLLFFRARGGELSEVDAGDQGILAGRYFEEFPGHILGREVGRDAGEDDQTKAPRWGYQVMGEFTRLPDLVERPVCSDCQVITFPTGRLSPRGDSRVGVTRQTDAEVTHRSRELAAAVTLGLRVDRYLALVAAENADEPPMLWPELFEALSAWRKTHGNPHGHVELVKLARGGTTGAERFLSAFDRAGGIIEGLRHAPPRPEPRYAGRVEDVPAQAELLYRSNRSLSVAELLAFHRSIGGRFEAVRHTDDAGVMTLRRARIAESRLAKWAGRALPVVGAGVAVFSSGEAFAAASEAADQGDYTGAGYEATQGTLSLVGAAFEPADWVSLGIDLPWVAYNTPPSDATYKDLTPYLDDSERLYNEANPLGTNGMEHLIGAPRSEPSPEEVLYCSYNPNAIECMGFSRSSEIAGP